MNKESIQDFRKRIETQNTAVLRRIWETEYRDEWTDEQFQVVKEILSKRGEDVSLSEQNSPLPLPDPTFSDSRIVPPDRYPNPQEGKKSSQWKNWSDLPLLLKIDEVADLLRIDVNEVEKLRQNGQLKANRIGDHWVFRRDEIKAFLDDVVLESKVSDNLPNFSTPTDYVSIDQPVKQKGKWGKVISVLASIGLLLLMSRNLVRVGQLYSRSGGAFTSLSPTATYQAVAPKKPTPIPTSSPSPMPKPTPTRAPTVRVKIITKKLNVREGPGIEFAVVGQVSSGDGFKILARNTPGNWVKIKFALGSEGWISSDPKYVEVIGELKSVKIDVGPSLNENSSPEKVDRGTADDRLNCMVNMPREFQDYCKSENMPAFVGTCVGASVAGQHVGEQVCVWGTVFSTYQSDEAFFINLSAADSLRFYGVSFDYYWEDLEGLCVILDGTIETYNGRPQIIITQSDQLRSCFSQ